MLHPTPGSVNRPKRGLGRKRSSQSSGGERGEASSAKTGLVGLLLLGGILVLFVVFHSRYSRMEQRIEQRVLRRQQQQQLLEHHQEEQEQEQQERQASTTFRDLGSGATNSTELASRGQQPQEQPQPRTRPLLRNQAKQHDRPGNRTSTRNGEALSHLHSYEVQEGSQTLELFGNVDVHLLWARPVAAATAAARCPTAMLLHGAHSSSAAWRDAGTLHYLAQRGIHVVAVDLPGHGNSTRVRFRERGPGPFLTTLLHVLTEEKHILERPPVLVAPSMSGIFALPAIVDHPESVSGYVPISAVHPTRISAHQVEAGLGTMPVLVVWGAEDSRGRSRAEPFAGLPLAQTLTLAAAPQSLGAPPFSSDAFHAALSDFVWEASSQR